MHIQRAVACLELEVRSGVALTLTISGGVAVSPEDGATYDDLLGAADRRMYQDKERTKRRDAQVGGRRFRWLGSIKRHPIILSFRVTSCTASPHGSRSMARTSPFGAVCGSPSGVAPPAIRRWRTLAMSSTMNAT